MIDQKTTWCCLPQEKKVLLENELPNARRKLWELSPHFFCSVIGTCIASKTLREIARKSGVSGFSSLSDYEIHRRATASCSDEQSRFAKLIYNCLEKQSKASIKMLSTLSAAEVRKQWKVSLLNGEVGTVYWALITHPIASDDMIEQAFADVHMRSHLAESDINGYQKQIDSLTRKIAQSEKKSESRLEAFKSLQDQVELDKESRRLAVDQEAAETLQADSLRLRVDAENLTAKLNMERLKNEELLDEFQLLQATHAKTQDKLTESERKLSAMEAKAFAQRSNSAHKASKKSSQLCDKTIDDPDLAGRCIVYVGGRTRQCGRFKNIVLKRNGKFLHHDGGLEDTNRLDSVLAKADAVMCPMDCVSHNAMVKARKHCKQQGKPLIMLEKSSLTAFSSGLQQVSAYHDNA